MFQARSVLEATIILLWVMAKYTFPVIIYFSATEIGMYSFYRKNLIATLNACMHAEAMTFHNDQRNHIK